jgi:ubiquinone/menaquinone biosynthesis C-methylase UbiE
MTPRSQARVDFVLALRRRWAEQLYPALREQYDERAGRAGDAAVEAIVHDLPSYRWFAFLERNSQKALWRAVGEAVDSEVDTEGAAPAADRRAARLTLDTRVELPAWYTGVDIHIQPGGVWSSARAARVYELGAKLVMLAKNDDYAFHRLFVSTALPEREYRRIVDLGCGFGKSTWPFKQAFPDAEVIGVDLAAPCLELAAQKSHALGLAIDFRQADCAATGIEAGSADLVTSTMLIHELPPRHLAATLREAARLLKPGGVLRFLDFHPTGDAFRDLAMREHGERNNEPFMPPLFDSDVPQLCADAGLAEPHWHAFDERGEGKLSGLVWPKRREWHFPWAVLEAEKEAS